MNSSEDALEILKETSRTFYIPISHLPLGLQEAVASAYLCMRAVDEIEDHPELDNQTKIKLLQTISLTLQATADDLIIDDFSRVFSLHQGQLPEVSIRIGEWARLAPGTIAPRIWDATASMADRMAYWAFHGWAIRTETDLDCYTFGVAGAVGLLLSDLWAWYSGTNTNRSQAIGFGRGLQAVNILRNRTEDLARGVDFFPDGWNTEDMHIYAKRNLLLADSYTQALELGPILEFCQVPLALAHATLDALVQGEHKLSRTAVINIIKHLTSGSGQESINCSVYQGLG